MPLLKITQDFIEYLTEDTNLFEHLTTIFTSWVWLGDHCEGYSTYLVSAEGFEPGEYYVNIVITTTPVQTENGPKMDLSLSLERV